VTVDLPQVEGATCAAARAVHVEPWRAGNQRRTDRGRPKHLAPGGELFVPAVYNALRFGTRSAISFLPLGVDGNVEPARPDAHGEVRYRGGAQGDHVFPRNQTRNRFAIRFTLTFRPPDIA
jgi:hypothetical protein